MSETRDGLRQEAAQLTSQVRRHLEELRDKGVYVGQPGAALPPPPAIDAAAAIRDAADGNAHQISSLAHPTTEGAGAPAAVATSEPPSVAADATERWAPHQSLQVIRDDLGDCTRCKLHQGRHNIVFGVGAARTPLMFIGEGPGAEEDKRGEPFVGAAGQLLDKMIVAMGWTRQSVYIANIVKCRPPGNRDPEPDEVAACSPFLRRQIESIGPRVIVALGRPASQTLLSTNAPISALRGRFHDVGAIRIMPTFHPAYLLRSPDKKREAWNDLKQVIEQLARLGVRPPGAPKV